jgi:hypothetical protein
MFTLCTCAETIASTLTLQWHAACGIALVAAAAAAAVVTSLFA